MNRKKSLFCCIALLFLLLFSGSVSAQKAVPAAGALDDSGSGLWNYYRGKTKTTVKRNAPMFEELKDSGAYLLDYKKIKGVELFLSGEFTKNKLTKLQITTPFPEHDSCGKETKDLSRSFAAIGYAMMGVAFDAKKDCTQVSGKGGSMVCRAEGYACVYRLCPEDSWALVCSITE